MGNDIRLHEKIDLFHRDMPVILHKDRLSAVEPYHFECHWHDQIEMIYVTGGEALFRCNSEDYSAKSGDLIVVNSNELHQGTYVGEYAEYYCIIFDNLLLQGRHADACGAKYIEPISQNRILFANKVENDPEVGAYIRRFAKEYDEKEFGYEIALKATIYELLLHLLRHHVKQTLTPVEYENRVKNLKRFNRVLEYIEAHFNENITIDTLCDMAGLSRYYFCRLFKSITGSTLSGYVNALRISKAETMLKNGSMNVSETALACGIDDLNYFSRLFRKYKNMTPSEVVRGGERSVMKTGARNSGIPRS